MMKTKGLVLSFIIVITVAALVVAFFMYSDLSRYVPARVVPGFEEEEQRLEKKLRLSIPDDAQPGTYRLRVGWEDPEEGNILALSEEITVVVSSSDDNGGGGDDGGGGDGGGGDDGGGGNGEPASSPARTYTFAPSRGHQISGSYSGVRQDSGLTVVTLAHAKARLAKKVKVVRGNYWLYINAKHDRPGPVDLAVYLNDRAWKVIRLDKNDDRYRTHRVGLLRNFSGGNIRFRFLNDIYDKSDPTNEVRDRNLHIASWGLTTDSSRLPLQKPSSQAVGGGKSSGHAVLPRLNQIVREELGHKFVSFNIWQYYAQRLTVSPTARESIQSEARLRNVMRYWRGVRPSSPRGDP